MRDVAVLFARQTSVYKGMPGCDVYDAARDARTWPGGCPAIAHPPCRAWGRLRTFAKPRGDEKALGVWAVDQVQRWGGVLEHPAHSTLWEHRSLPRPGEIDSLGGLTLAAPQFWWGHRAEKLTWFYIVGVAAANVPAVPLVLGEPTHVVSSKTPGRLELSKAARESTPIELALWLVDLARRAQV